jgi:hypothetical protein
MAEVVRNAQQEFWRPPMVASEPRPGMVEVCDGCGAEFMVGARFCHICGTSRAQTGPEAARWTRFVEFHTIERALGLSPASLLAFGVGLVCVLIAAIGLNLRYSIQTFSDFQAVQYYRIQWLLGAVAAFVAGILLKKKTPDPKP